MLRFRVFGKLLGITWDGSTWLTYYLGPDGKRRPADFAIPEFLREDELGQFLEDLFHESAMPWNDSVERLDVLAPTGN
jgi:hypothetical protein